MGRPRRRQAAESGLVAEFDDRRERDDDPIATAIRRAQPIRKAPAAGLGWGLNSRRIATMTPNGDGAVMSA